MAQTSEEKIEPDNNECTERQPETGVIGHFGIEVSPRVDKGLFGTALEPGDAGYGCLFWTTRLSCISILFVYARLEPYTEPFEYR